MRFKKVIVLLQSLQLSAWFRSHATRVLTASKGSCIGSILWVVGIARGRDLGSQHEIVHIAEEECSPVAFTEAQSSPGTG